MSVHIHPSGTVLTQKFTVFLHCICLYCMCMRVRLWLTHSRFQFSSQFSAPCVHVCTSGTVMTYMLKGLLTPFFGCVYVIYILPVWLRLHPNPHVHIESTSHPAQEIIFYNLMTCTHMYISPHLYWSLEAILPFNYVEQHKFPVDFHVLY